MSAVIKSVVFEMVESEDGTYVPTGEFSDAVVREQIGAGRPRMNAFDDMTREEILAILWMVVNDSPDHKFMVSEPTHKWFDGDRALLDIAIDTNTYGLVLHATMKPVADPEVE